MKWLTLLLLVGCAFPEKWVHGTLIRVQHNDAYEAPCGIRARAARECDEMPVCCSYQATVRDSALHDTQFWAFWPRRVPGLLGLVPLGTSARFHLRVHQLYDLQSCGSYGCPSRLEYTVDGDDDVKPDP